MPEIVISLRMTYKQVALQSLSQNPKLYRDSLLRPQLSCSEPKQTRAAPDVCDGRALQRGTCPLISSRPISLLICSNDLWAVDALFGSQCLRCRVQFPRMAAQRVIQITRYYAMRDRTQRHHICRVAALFCVLRASNFQERCLSCRNLTFLLLKTNCFSQLDQYCFNNAHKTAQNSGTKDLLR